MVRKITTGIDIGTSQVKVMVAEESVINDKPAIKILGTGFSESRGLRNGYIINQPDVSKAIKQAAAQAEKLSGMRIKRAYLSIGGIGLSSVTVHGTAVVTRADQEVTDHDVEKAMQAAQAAIPQALSLNRRIIHSIPVQFRIDGKPVLGVNPVGMKGGKLEARMHFILCLENHLADLVEAVEEAGIEVIEEVAAPLAASLVTLTKTQKVAGCVLANIGAETVSVVVYENNIPVSLEIFPIGSNDITNDIALGLKVPLEEAEQIKLGIFTGTAYPKKKLDDIIEARLSDILELVEAHLKKIGRGGLLPAGIILTGGGSGLAVLEELAKSSLNIPSKIASMNWSGNMKEPIKDASWSVAYGLCKLGLSNGDADVTLGTALAKRAKSSVLGFLKQLLP